LDFRDFETTMQAQRCVLTNSDANSHLSAREVEPGMWIARNVMIHPTAHLTTPLFIGENSRIGEGATIGPNAVIGRDSIVDKHTRIIDSAVYPGSYCGENLELDHVIVDRNRLLDGHLGAVVKVTDSFILSSLKGQRKSEQWFRSVLSVCLGALLFVLTLAIVLSTAVALAMLRQGPVLYRKRVVRIPASEEPESWQYFDLWSFRNPEHPGTDKLWRWILFDFLPALPQVVKGDLRLIGVQPRSKDEIQSTPTDWKALYLQANAGLITEAFVLHGASATEDEIYSSEVYYSAMTSLTHDVSLALRFVTRR
jgi:carbonic anhydrase/acetyltransferase-like protein (isoleucine patch superfamily)